MTRYVAKRLLGAIPLVLGVATILFFVLEVAPGDPSSVLLTPGTPPEVVEQLRANYGLDRPVHVRYLRWIGNVLVGDLGDSISRRQPVTTVIGQVLPNTILLSSVALALAFLGGISMGVIQAVRQHSKTDSVLSIVALFFYSMPSFWLGLMMILVFGYYADVLGWPVHFPISDMRSADHDLMGPLEGALDIAHHLVLPATTLALVLAAGIGRFTRSSMLEVIRQDFVRTARAKGLPEHRVVLGHALRNALIPVVTLLGLYLPVLFSGTVFVEAVFAWPGMGRTVVDAIVARDYPLIMGGGLVFGVVVVVGNLIADVLYAIVDPRIRHG